MRELLLVGAGGAIGALLRFLVTESTYKYTTLNAPWGTIIVNLVGCLIIGIVWGLLDTFPVSINSKLFVLIGVLGAFTTFSTFALENFNLLKSGAIPMLIMNISISNIVGIGLVFGGYYLSRFVLSGLNR